MPSERLCASPGASWAMESPLAWRVIGTINDLECSTPCGINGILTQVQVQGFSLPTKCSTPCGINGILTLAIRAGWDDRDMCSTPCGINGILTGYLTLSL